MTEDADSEAEPGLDPREQRSAVQERYGTIAVEGTSCCGDADVDETSSCCDADGADDDSPAAARALGYSEEDVESVVDGANLNLGCGNPTALADLRPGETVVDLGSGGGFDCLLAAREVGEDGRVIGVDMTPEMVERARENAERDDASNVEFRLGEIEHPPVADGTADVIISNCVLNLSPEKPQVLREAHRVLRPGGRLAVSDVVLTADLPVDLRTEPDSVAACVGGAASIPELESMLADAGFRRVEIEPKAESETFIREWDEELDLSDYVVSARIAAEKPER
jgi:SAM-dependent methyltransferase